MTKDVYLEGKRVMWTPELWREQFEEICKRVQRRPVLDDQDKYDIKWLIGYVEYLLADNDVCHKRLEALHDGKQSDSDRDPGDG